MSRNTKIILGIIAGLVVICMCVAVLGFFALRQAGDLAMQAMDVSEDPQEVGSIAQGIVDYDLPAGYSEQFGMSFFGFDMVAFGTGNSNDPVIMLMQFPEEAGLSQVQMEAQMEEAIQRQMGRREFDLPVVDQRTTTIQDQEVTLTVREGTDSEGQSLRQITGLFDGQSGVVMLMIMGPTQNWDSNAIDSFIASLG